MIHADPHLAYIPSTLINMGLQQCCMVFLNLVERRSQNLAPEYFRLIEEKRLFYDACTAMMNGVSV